MAQSMNDILHPGGSVDPEFPHGPEGWNRQNAESVAGDEALNLTDDHWEAIRALQDYFELIDWSGRVFHPDKRGIIEENTPPILKRIGIEPSQFIQCAGDFMHVFGLTVGSPELMAECCARRDVKFLRGIKASRELLGAA